MAQAFKMWEPGWLPEGWKRGDALCVINSRFRFGPMMALERVLVAPYPGGPSYADSTAANVQFHEHEIGRVFVWLRWFCTADNYATLQRLIY